MPLKEEFYRAIARHGASGISQTGLEIYLAQQRYTVRMLIKQALNDGIIKSYIKDMGRQRTTM